MLCPGIEHQRVFQLAGVHQRLMVVAMAPYLTVFLAQSQVSQRHLSTLVLIQKEMSLIWNHSLITVAAFWPPPPLRDGLRHAIQSRQMKVVRMMMHILYDSYCYVFSVPSTAPRGVVIISTSSSAVSISWTPPLKPNGIIILYYIYWWYLNPPSGPLRIQLSSLSYELKNLKFGQSISVQVSSSTSVGEGIKSQKVNVPIGMYVIAFN